MKIGILQAGGPPKSLRPRFGSYGAMFQTLLGGGFDTTVFDVTQGALPDRPQAYDGYIITGSPAGVYDDLPWIAPLQAFLQAAKGRAKLVGICFGHQIMAQAFGGRVEKVDRGWGLGLHGYEVYEHAPWMDMVDRIAVPVSHQDQVTTPPPHALVVAGSGFTPYGMLAYGDQPALSMQCHPEFEPAFVAALLALQRPTLADPGLADAAAATLRQPNDRERVSTWIRQFLLD